MAKEKDEKPEIAGGAAPEAEGAAVTTDHNFRLMMAKVKEYGIFMLDPQGRIVSWNAGAERINGYRADEVLGKHISIFYTKEDIQAGVPDRELESARNLGQVSLEGWRIRKDGSRYWVVVTVTTFFDEKGRLLGFSKITRDATERRKTEDALQKSRVMFERLFENSPDAVVVVDPNGVIRKVNRQAEALFGYMREEMLGHHVEMLIPERYQKQHRHFRSGYFEDPRVRKMGMGLQLYGINRDGFEFPADIMLSPIETGQGTWAFAVVRDVTVQKQHESMINDLNEALKKQVEQLAAANRELESFSYSVSHDLRAPLRHVTGFVNLLTEKAPAGLDDKSKHYLKVISDAAQKMGVLIDDLLAFSRMGRTEMMKTRVDLAVLVHDVVTTLAADVKERDIEWVIGELPVVVGDPSMLRQVMINLIGNALKFTRTRPKARIEVGAVTDDPAQAVIFVRDNGVGFDAQYMDKLFSLFQRLHTMEEFEGTGVGLAIVQRIMQRHGGKAWAEGSIDGGATFWFSLPNEAAGAGSPS